MARIAVICFAAMALFGSVVAQSPATSPTSDCLSYITTLAPCLKFVTTPTNQTKPDKDCCTALSTVVSTKVTCLCLLLNSSNSLGLQINMTQALALPAACNVKSPSVSQCKAASSPTAMSPTKSPAMSPAKSSAMSPLLSPAMSPHLSPVTSPLMSPTASPAASPTTSQASSPAPVSSPPTPAPFTGGIAPAPASGTSGEAPAPAGKVPSSTSTSPSTKSPSPTPAENSVNSAGTIFAPSAVFAFVGFVLATLQLGI